MPLSVLLEVAVLILAVAIAYSAVGNAGASAYLAAMALFGIDPGTMKPSALTLNILVALIALIRFRRAGCFSWQLFWPFAVTSIPFAFIGGALALPASIYRPLVSGTLFFSAGWLFRSARKPKVAAVRHDPPRLAAMLAGAGIGLLSGLTGVGGGVFLSPLLLAMGWADLGMASGIAAAFILFNSIAGLSGLLLGAASLPLAIVAWAPAALLGGWIGARYGSTHYTNQKLRYLLGIILAVSGLKMLLF